MAGAPPGGGRNAPSFLAAIAAGTKAGQASYEQYVGKKRAVDTMGDISDILSGGLTPKALEDAIARAVRGGDMDTARTLSPILTALIGQEGGTLPNLMKHELENGQVAFFNPKTGQHVTTYTPPPGEGAPDLTEEQMRIISQAYGQYDTTTKTMREVPLQVRRVFAPTNRLIASFNDPNITEDQKKELAFAAVSALSAYARTIDPGSVVRSEEMQLLLGQGDLVTKLETLVNRVLSGRTSVQIARALQAEARAQLMAQAPVFFQEKETAENRLRRFGFDPRYFEFSDPYTPLINELFDEQGRPKATNMIGMPRGDQATGAARVQQYLPQP